MGLLKIQKEEIWKVFEEELPLWQFLLWHFPKYTFYELQKNIYLNLNS